MVAGATIFTSPTYHLLSLDVPSRRQLDRLSFIFAVILRFMLAHCQCHVSQANSSLPLSKSSLSNGISMSVFSLVVVSCWSRSSFIQLRAQPKISNHICSRLSSSIIAVSFDRISTVTAMMSVLLRWHRFSAGTLRQALRATVRLDV